MDWYPRRPQPYRNDTWGLTLAEHGAYCLLLDYYYTSECPLPSDDEKLASIIGCSLSDWLSVKENVTRYFRVSNAHLTHATCDEVIERALGRRKDGLQRQSKYRKRLDTVTRLSRVSNAPRGEERKEEERIKKESNKIHAPLEENGAGKIEENSSLPLKGKPNGSGKRGTRLPEGWQPSPEDRLLANKRGLDGDALKDQIENFIDYRSSVVGKNGYSLDWSRTYRNDVRRVTANRKSGGPSPGSHGQKDSGTVAAMRRLIDKHRRGLEP